MFAGIVVEVGASREAPVVVSSRVKEREDPKQQLGRSPCRGRLWWKGLAAPALVGEASLESFIAGGGQWTHHRG